MRGEAIGAALKRMGVERRAPFEPSRPEKWANAPPHTQAENIHVVSPTQPETPASEETLASPMQPRRVSSRRKIIALSDSDKKAKMLYEKEY